MKRRIQKVKITLPDNRVGEFFGEELVKPDELEPVSRVKLGIKIYEAVEIEWKEKRDAGASKG